MSRRDVHFVFGLAEQRLPFHFLHHVAIESCVRVLEPETVYFHYKHLPWGPWWDHVRPYLTLVEVDLAHEVLTADYSSGRVPPSYRYAHHADVIRLDALIEHGGIYADIDTIFVRPFPPELVRAPFVIGREPPVRDEQTGEARSSLCNALMISEPGSQFARAWRDRLASALNGTWSNHSGFLSHALSEEMPDAVRVEPEATFFPFPSAPAGLAQLFEERCAIPASTLSVHLWAHLWWQRNRRDMSDANAGWCTPSAIRRARTTFADLVRPYVRSGDTDRGPGHVESPTRVSRNWVYVSVDEPSGYGVAAERCRAALEDSGVEIDWAPCVSGGRWPPPGLDPFEQPDLQVGAVEGPGLTASHEDGRGRVVRRGQVVVAHLVPEYYPGIRERCPQGFLVGHTAWETDRIPDHWIECLDAADLLVVPSQFNAEVFASSPVRTPVEVVPHVAPPPRVAASREWSAIPEDVFVFYTIAEWNERKAVTKTVEAYLRAFRRGDPVVLIVKTSHRDFRVAPPAGLRALEEGTSAWALRSILARYPEPPAVRLDTRPLDDDDIAALHDRGDCFVSLSRGEAWGLGAFDAAARGNPVVTTGFGGQLDYLAGSRSLVEFDLVPVENPAGFPSYAPNQRWAEPDIDHGATLLREVIANPEEARAAAGALAEEIRWRYRPQAVATAFQLAVDTHVGRSRPRSTSRRGGRARSANAMAGVRWLSVVPGSGYGNSSADYLSGLRATGLPVTWTPMGWPSTAWQHPYGPLTEPDVDGFSHRDIANLPIRHDVVVVHSPPLWHERLALEAAGRLLVAVTTWETDKLPDEWLPVLDRYDRVVVPSQFNKAVFESSGLTVPVSVVPHIARPLPDPRGPTRRRPDDRFVFYLIATWSTRKAILDTVEAYLSAFTADDDVVLVIHTTPRDLVAAAQRAPLGLPSTPEEESELTLARTLAGRSHVPEIVLSTRQLTEAEIDGLHTRGDCFISLSRGEGFGLGAFDAATFGNPVIVTGWGGTLDFLPDDYPYRVDYDLVPTITETPDAYWTPRLGENWAKARIPHAAALLRHVFEHRDEARAWGSVLQSNILANFGSAQVTRRLIDAFGSGQ